MSALVSTLSKGASNLEIPSNLAVPEVESSEFPPVVARFSRDGEPPEQAALECEAPESWQLRQSEAPDGGREEHNHDDGRFSHGRSKG
jgi:hypothetical protein